MELPKWLTSVTPFSKLLALLLFIFLPITAFFFGMNYQKKLTVINQQQLTSIPQKQQQINEIEINKCPSYGKIEDQEELYEKYVVQPGDTLLSIAQTKLGSKSRIGDIVYINEKNYPGLSIKNPYIEPAWILYLPPSYIDVINIESAGIPRLLFGWSGGLTDISEDGRWIIDGPDADHRYGFTPDTNTKFFHKAKDEFSVGDCVKAVLEGYTQRVYVVYLQ